MIVAIDGPAASGKSTVARSLAVRLGFGYLDTGAMYRSIAAEALRLAVPIDDEAALAELADEAVIEFERESGSPLPTKVIVNGRDATSEIRSPAVDAAVSPVSAVRGVREAMVRIQRHTASSGDWVVEGRDIGTVVFPNASVKIFLTATVDERARRRAVDMDRLGHAMEDTDVSERIAARDRYDSTREASPLAAADDALLLDTTGMTVEQVVDVIAEMVEAER